jgi:hypothetical protein
MRGILEEFWGLPHRSITWMTERAEDVDCTPPPGLKIELVPPGGPSLEDRVVSGEFDGLLTPTLPKPFIAGNPNIKRLFENYRQVELDYWNKTKIFPIMHVTIIREDIVKELRGSRRASRAPSTRPRRWPTRACAIRAWCRSRGSRPTGTSRMKCSGTIRGSTVSAR